MTVIRHQDPEAAESPFLLPGLLAAASAATRGGAFFAFASRDGIRAVLGSAEFRDFLARGTFDLVVGVDAITDQRALDELKAIATASPGLAVKAFLHEGPRLFHPKICWFENAVGGIAFVGSGNLTVGGLTQNWEAFGEIELAHAGIAEVKAGWLAWTGRHAAQLRDVDDPDIRARVARNLARRPPAPPAAVSAPATAAPGKTTPSPAGVVSTGTIPITLAPDGTILLAEIPGPARWSQANFDLATFRTFFGADPLKSRLLILLRLRDDGSVDGSELHPTVAVRSHNYRIELEAAIGRAYPTGADRPIAAFRKVSSTQFRYILLMPGDAAYATALALLTTGAGARDGSRMRRHQFTPTEVSLAWPACPLLVPWEDEEPAVS